MHVAKAKLRMTDRNVGKGQTIKMEDKQSDPYVVLFFAGVSKINIYHFIFRLNF